MSPLALVSLRRIVLITVAFLLLPAAGSKNQGGAYVPPNFGGMYAPSGQGRRHAKLRHVCATRNCFSWAFAGRRPLRTGLQKTLCQAR